MANDGTIKLKIASPEKVIMEGQVRSILVPASQGPLMVLPRRAPYISSLKVGVLDATLPNGTSQVFFCEGGMVEVKDDTCIVLTESAVQVTKESRIDYAHYLLEYRKQLKETKTDSERHLLNNRIKYVEMLIRAVDNFKK